MRIIRMRPVGDQSGDRRHLLARFDVQVTPEISIMGMSLKQKPNGELRTFAPNFQGVHVAHFSPELATEITRAAEAAYNEIEADARHDRTSQ